MAELKESSILFSLNGLFDRERERVAEAAERECRRIEAEQLERLERERRLIERRELLRREDEARERREEQRRHEEAARIEALREAEVARACAEAEAKARVELDAKRREHELRLGSIRENAGRRRAQQIAAGCALLALASWAAAAWFYFGQIEPERERDRTDYEGIVGNERDRSRELQRLLEDSQRRNAELAASLKRALDRAAVQPAATAQPRVPRHSGSAAPARRGDKPPVRPTLRRPCRNDGDPMDDCL